MTSAKRTKKNARDKFGDIQRLLFFLFVVSFSSSLETHSSALILFVSRHLFTCLVDIHHSSSHSASVSLDLSFAFLIHNTRSPQQQRKKATKKKSPQPTDIKKSSAQR